MGKKTMISLVVVMLVAVLCFSALASSVYFTGNCNVRSGPGLTYSMIGSVNRGSYLTYLGDTSVDNRGVAWYRVAFGSGSGWVSSVYGNITSGSGSATYGAGGGGGAPYSGYVNPSPYGNPNPNPNPDPAPSGRNVRAISGDTYLRTGPGLSYSKIGVLYQGQAAEYLNDTQYDNRGVAWYYVRWGGGNGWVSSRYTTLY